MTLPLRTWTEIGSPAATLIAGDNDLYATNPETGDIWQWNGTPNQWTRIGTPGNMFVAGTGALYGLSPDQQVVYHYNGTPYHWTEIGGPADAIAAAGDYLYRVKFGYTQCLGMEDTVGPYRSGSRRRHYCLPAP